MSYVDNNLLPDEHVLFQTKKHRIIFFFPAVWFIFCLYATQYMLHDTLLIKVLFAPWLVGAIFFISVWISYATSEFAVTNKRLVMREGLFNRHVNEMRLSAISQVNVDQTLFGQLLGYGAITINAFGAYDAFTLIAQPLLFQKFVNEQLDKVVR